MDSMNLLENRDAFRCSRWLAPAFAGFLLAGGGVAQAACGGFDYVQGVRAVARHDIAAEITDIQFRAGDDPAFTVYFTVDAEDLGPFEVVGKFGVEVDKARIGPGKTASAARCFRFGPRRFDGPGPYKVTFRLRGKDWGGVLPEATYKSSIKVALTQGGRMYRDLNMEDNSSKMAKRYYTEIFAKADPKVEGTRQDDAITLAVEVANGGNRPSGDLDLRWWTRGDFDKEDDGASFEAEEETTLEHTFEKNPKQKRFGPRARLIAKDHLGIRRLRVEADIPRGGGLVIDPDPIDPIDPGPRPEGVDYHVTDVHSNMISMGDGHFLLSSTVVNEGTADADEPAKVRWSQLTLDGPFQFAPLVNQVPALKAARSHELLATLDLSGAEDPSMRAREIAGVLTVSSVTGEVDPPDNSRRFGVTLGCPAPEATPPDIVLAEVGAGADDPEYAGWDGELLVTAQLQNNGGEAEAVEWSLQVRGPDGELTPSDPDASQGFRAEHVGAGDSLDKQVVGFVLKPGHFAEVVGQPRILKGVITGTTRYRRYRDEVVDGPAFEYPIELELKATYPRPDLEVSVYVEDQSGNRYEPRDQIFSETDGDAQVDVEVLNLGRVAVHRDDKVRVEFGIDGYRDDDFFEVAGAPLGDVAGVKSLTLGVDCSYWNGNRNPFAVSASDAPTETALENNSSDMGLKLAPGVACP